LVQGPDEKIAPGSTAKDYENLKEFSDVQIRGKKFLHFATYGKNPDNIP
jgi:hypothetical protein